VRAERDVRDELCRALVKADIGVLGLGRERELESMFLELLDDGGEAPRRKKKRRKEGEAAEPAAAVENPVAEKAASSEGEAS
jgi:hypothetical protein